MINLQRLLEQRLLLKLRGLFISLKKSERRYDKLMSNTEDQAPGSQAALPEEEKQAYVIFRGFEGCQGDNDCSLFHNPTKSADVQLMHAND